MRGKRGNRLYWCIEVGQKEQMGRTCWRASSKHYGLGKVQWLAFGGQYSSIG